MTHTLVCHLPPLGGGWEGANMKYIKPTIKAEEAQATEMMAVSIIQGGTADDSEVLTKANTDWDIWGDE